MRLTLLSLLLSTLLAVSATADAHRYHFGHIELTRNVNSGNLEIVHQYFTHDFEAVLGSLKDQRVSDYIAQHVQFIDDQGKELSATYIGTDTDVGNTYIYQEVINPTSKYVDVKFSTLMDKVEDQVNTLNVVNKNGDTVSFTFKFSTDRHRVTLP